MNIKEISNGVLINEKLPKDSTEAIDFAVNEAIDYILSQLDTRVVQGASYQTVIAEIKAELGK